jgi:hypothetical protein
MSPFCEANISLTNKQTLHILSNPKFHHVFKSLPHVSCPEPDQSNPCVPSCFSKMSCNVIQPYMRGYSIWSFRSGFPNKSYAYFISPCMLHTPRISSFVWFLKQYFVKSRDYEPAHNVVFFSPLLPSPFSPRHHSQHLNLKHPQPVFLPCETMMKVQLLSTDMLYSACQYWERYCHKDTDCAT